MISDTEYQRLYASPPRTLPGRVNRAALLLRGGMGRSRAFDDCFEMGGGADILARLLHRAHTESPELLEMMKDQGNWSEAFAVCPPTPAPLALSHEDRTYALSRATAGLPRVMTRRGVSLADGLTDARLAEALSSAMGEHGGCGGPDEPSLAWCGAGLRIWASWESVNTVQDTPVFQGVATVRAAREHWRIPDPDEAQLCLFDRDASASG
ncbi:hypothetical protein [Thalassobaculum litoreum]|uniref:Uncharacterized protein n=1 Tax=Thalassobaculum litoreum DSM 18839 TaxID=1123362 RepID=A0A8G2BL91_9PROT|nr:hypothetical protein [Thalassobaculum litoreum]SDG14221.1 hypothetical protein SAMN05660686_03477 [Thalassobaculum litoreum DSM 18839]